MWIEFEKKKYDLYSGRTRANTNLSFYYNFKFRHKTNIESLQNNCLKHKLKKS